MDTSTNTWLTELVQTNLDILAARAADAARARVSWYRNIPPERLHTMFATTYGVLAEVFPADNLTPLRLYMDAVITERIRSGATALDLLDVIAIIESELIRLIDAQTDVPAARRLEASRQTTTIIRNMRMILSSINLRLLTQAPAKTRREM